MKNSTLLLIKGIKKTENNPKGPKRPQKALLIIHKGTIKKPNVKLSTVFPIKIIKKSKKDIKDQITQNETTARPE